MNEMKVGNTQRGVSLGVLQTLQRRMDSKNSSVLIDVPCGDGQFAQYLMTKINNLRVIGIDYFADATNKGIEFFKLKAHDYFRQQKVTNVDVITCVSGVMCFDGIEELFELFQKSLRDQGLLIVTNDNFMTVRDRFNFLFFGRFKRFKLCYEVHEGNWNSLSPQGVVMLLQRQNFKDIQIKYTSIYNEDYLLLPIALILYPFFYAYLVLHKSSMPVSLRRALFPFKSLLARHYIVSAIK